MPARPRVTTATCIWMNISGYRNFGATQSGFRYGYSQKWRQTYFSTPSSLTHSAYPFWSGALFNRGRNKADKVDIDLSHSNLAPACCAQTAIPPDSHRGRCGAEAAVTCSTLTSCAWVQPRRIPEPADVRVCGRSRVRVSCSASCRRAWWTVGKSGPTFMLWPCARRLARSVDRL